jgi:N-acetylneuraminate synthase/N,N'-diacetyllegionaminate synthase
MTLRIGARDVGPGRPCFVIAEAGVNHNGRLDLAFALVDAAKAAGADAVKFQLYRAEEQASRAARTADYQSERTGADSMLEMAKSYDLPWEAHREIVAHCRAVGITYMASCFDARAVDFLIEIGGDAIKVGSGEITNFPLLAHMSRTGLPVLLSTGMSTLEDVAAAVAAVREAGPSPLVLFQCSSNYPADPRTANLRVLTAYAHAFGVPVAYSDHTPGDLVAALSVAFGACMVEKHFTVDKTLAGPDHAMSLDPDELRRYVETIRTAEAALGDGVKRVLESERPTQLAARRSLVSAHALRAGERLDEGAVTLKRPASGIDPRLWAAVRGRETRVDIPADVPITWDMLA